MNAPLERPARLLIVDDLPENLELLSRRLTRAGFDCTVSPSGRAALELIERSSFDLVLLDWMMPDLNGLEVLRILRRTYPATVLPVVMVTALAESSQMVEAFAAGANDYVTKPVDFPVMLARLQTQLGLKHAVDQVRELETYLAEKNEHLTTANSRISQMVDHMQGELDAAARMQRALLPAEIPLVPGLDCAWAYHPCDQLGGDLLNIIPLTESVIAFYVFDVSGHGLQAALRAVTLHQLLSDDDPEHSMLLDRDAAGVLRPRSPADLARHLNRMSPMEDFSGQYFTLLYGLLDVRTREFRYVSAGHPPPLIWQGLEAEFAPCDAGYPIGWFADSEYSECVLTLTPEMRVFIFSDGLTEAGAHHGAALGTARLRALLSAHPEQSMRDGVATLVAAAGDWCAPYGLDDDLSLLALQLR